MTNNVFNLTPRQMAAKIRAAYPGAAGIALETADALDEMSDRLASLTTVTDEDVERLARQAMDETDGDEAWFDATPHNRTRVRSIVRAALTAFVSR